MVSLILGNPHNPFSHLGRAVCGALKRRRFELRGLEEFAFRITLNPKP